MSAVLAIAAAELAIARRNLWVAIATALMVLFSAVLTFAGSGPTGTLGVDLLTVAVTSLTTLSVYIVPLIALLLAFDAVAGEAERGTLALILSYPVPRAAILGGKFVAHLLVLAGALATGYAVAGGMAWALDRVSGDSLAALLRLFWTACLLGAAFLGLGYAVSARVRNPGAAAGLAIALWLVFVVLYDLGLLGALVADAGGTFTQTVFPWLLIGNPADAFRLANLPSGEVAALASGVAGASRAVSGAMALASLAVWPAGALLLAWAAFRRVTP